MTDVFPKSKRSEIMSRVRGSGNKATELALKGLFRKHHISGWRCGSKIFGKPDFVFPKQRLAVFVDGCFWHSCPKHFDHPANNAEFWKLKISRNKLRDRLVNRTLRKQGWSVLRVWQHQLSKRHEASLIEFLIGRLRKSN